MLRNTFLWTALAAFDARLLASAIPTENCPNLGPAFVHDFDLKKTKAFQAAEAAFPEVLETLFSSGAISKNTSTFSIDVFSTTTNESVYSYHHIGPDNNATLPTGRVDDGSIYRIGSVSKLFTAYAILAAAGIKVLDRPVTDYVPELLGGSSPNTIDWEEVTIGALMSQQGGVGGFREWKSQRSAL
jgi:CubicO group peptidase (beta-lactamase class C family)